MEVKVVTGASYGDEGKGLVSGCLAREAAENNNKILTIFFNGTGQRAHSFEGVTRHFMAAGESYGSDTFYHHMFVVDPIMLWLTKSTPIIDPRCRVIFPCDVLYGQAREKQLNHGSCGWGLFAAVKRNEKEPFYIADMFLKTFYKLAQQVDGYYNYEPNEIHNLPNFIRAVAWLKENCQVELFENIVENYDTIIYEGGQGLLLDQENKGNFPHLTPSSTGAFNIHKDIEQLNAQVDFVFKNNSDSYIDLFYVSRSYMTRHGAGPMDMEVAKESINPFIYDEVNQPNDWQGSLRFGHIDVQKLYKRIKGDATRYNCNKTINMVYTHLNYTDGYIAALDGKIDIMRPDFVTNVYGSDKKDFMERIKI